LALRVEKHCENALKVAEFLEQHPNVEFVKYPFLKFSVINAASSLVWALVVGLLSYYAGDFVRGLYERIKEAPWIAPLVLCTIAFAVVMYFRFATRKKASRG